MLLVELKKPLHAFWLFYYKSKTAAYFVQCIHSSFFFFSLLIMFYIVKFENISSDQFLIKCLIPGASKNCRYPHLKWLVLKAVLFECLPFDETYIATMHKVTIFKY